METPQKIAPLEDKDWCRLLSRALLDLVRELEKGGEDGFRGTRPGVHAAVVAGRALLRAYERNTLERAP